MRVIAEIGSPPSLEWALVAVEAAADAGVWAVKGQLLRPHTLTTRTAPAYHGDGIDAPARQWDGFADALPYSDWAEVKDRCDELGVEWFASCWDFEAVDFCESLGVRWYKVGSADITHKPLIEYVAATGKRIMLSTGASTEAEIRRALQWIADAGMQTTGEGDVVLMACALSYPCAPADANVRRVETLRETFGGEVGYSNHVPGFVGQLAAISVGADFMEQHFTITPNTGGDHDFAVDSVMIQGKQLADLDASMRERWKPGEWARRAGMWGDGHLAPMPCEQMARRFARRSIAAARDLPAGTRLQPGDLTWLRPGTGIPPYLTDDVAGLVLPVDVPAGTLLPADLLG